LLASLFVLFLVLQDFLLTLFDMDLPIPKDIEGGLKEYLTSDSYSRYVEALTSILVKTAIMSFTVGLLASHWALFLARRVIYPNLVKSLDYVYFSLSLLALYVNFSNIFEEEVLFRRALAIDLAMTAVALRIAKTTAEIRHWHR
jgi:ABC-type sugar transport system permease subunit